MSSDEVLHLKYCAGNQLVLAVPERNPEDLLPIKYVLCQLIGKNEYVPFDLSALIRLLNININLALVPTDVFSKFQSLESAVPMIFTGQNIERINPLPEIEQSEGAVSDAVVQPSVSEELQSNYDNMEQQESHELEFGQLPETISDQLQQSDITEAMEVTALPENYNPISQSENAQIQHDNVENGQIVVTETTNGESPTQYLLTFEQFSVFETNQQTNDETQNKQLNGIEPETLTENRNGTIAYIEVKIHNVREFPDFWMTCGGTAMCTLLPEHIDRLWTYPNLRKSSKDPINNAYIILSNEQLNAFLSTIGLAVAKLPPEQEETQSMFGVTEFLQGLPVVKLNNSETYADMYCNDILGRYGKILPLIPYQRCETRETTALYYVQQNPIMSTQVIQNKPLQ